ncbi:MAG: GAF domain-containing protein [Chloroflexi bacterium]|nr:GAF domain-containing protein [Chloroflexota bacterium]
MKREHWLIGYSVGVGLPGWIWFAWHSHLPSMPLWHIIVILILALLIECAGYRVPPADPRALTSIVVLSIALMGEPWVAAIIIAINAFVVGIALPLIDHRPVNFYSIVARPWSRAGVRIAAIALGAWLATLIPGMVGIVIQIAVYPLILIMNRWGKAIIEHGVAGVEQWWRSDAFSMLMTEIIPLPLVLLGAIIYPSFGIWYFSLLCLMLLGGSAVMLQLTINLRKQMASTNELAVLNITSRAIISSELDVDALCELIYREAGKVLDTSSFHLGIFEPNSDRYTLKVRVQDKQRLEPLTVDLPSGDGMIGWMRQTGRSLLVSDFMIEMERLPARPRYQSSNPPRSGIYVPLISGDVVIGSISVQSPRVEAFSADDLRRLNQIAEQAAVAITKARTFHEARERAIQLQAIQDVAAHLSDMLEPDELLPEVTRLIREHFGYHPVHCITINEDGTLCFRASTSDAQGGERIRTALRNAQKGIISTVAQTGHALLINDVHNDVRYVEDDPNTRSELAVPIRFADRIIGVLDVQSNEPWRFQDTDMFVMQTLADQVALALERARAFSAQRAEAQRLNVLLHAADMLNRPVPLDDLLNTAVQLPLQLLGCRRCCYLSFDQQHNQFVVEATAGLNDDEAEQLIQQRIDATSIDMHALPSNIVEFQQLPASVTHVLRPFAHQHTLVLIARGRSSIPGILVTDYPIENRPYGAREQQMFSGLAGQIGSAIENALLELDADNAARLEEELRLARDIQNSLLPDVAPAVPGWQINALWKAARVIGGDFYDYWPFTGSNGQEQFGFVIADVSDKGMAAALFMALSRSLVRAAALDGSDPAAALMRANRWITRDSESGMFVTIFYGILDTQSGELCYACAGHNPPLLVRANGTHEELTTPGIALGIIEEIRLTSSTVVMQPGDTLVCYTDGVTESFDDHDQQYGVTRLKQVIQRHMTAHSEQIVTAIADDVSAFSEGRIYDDVTLLVIQRH